MSGKHVAFPTLSGSGFKIAIIHTRWNEQIVDALVAGAKRALQACNVAAVDSVAVPGAYELPFAAQRYAGSGKYAAVICIGVLIKVERVCLSLCVCVCVWKGGELMGRVIGVFSLG